MSGLSPGCHNCYTERLYCLTNGCADDCLSSLEALGSEACANCAAGTLCDLARDKCARFDGGVHPCEPLCDMVVDSGCVDPAEYETCLAGCASIATTDDASLDTIACRVTRLQQGESCQDAQSLCEDPDKDGQNQLMGDCDNDESTVYVGAPELCDGLDNDCDSTPDDGLSFIDWYRRLLSLLRSAWKASAYVLCCTCFGTFFSSMP